MCQGCRAGLGLQVEKRELSIAEEGCGSSFNNDCRAHLQAVA